MPAATKKRAFRWSLPVGKVAGIPISVHVSFFLLVGLMAIANTGPGGLGWLETTVWLLLLFGCVTLHELAHSLLARRKGATVRSIVLLALGGVSQIEHLPEKWSDELWVALVGPLTSFAIGVAAVVMALLGGDSLLPISLASGPLLPRLAWANLLLGLFNLLPAFPLDGGRVLRAILERRQGVEGATHMAARIGRGAAIVLAVIGIFWDFWLILIAAFVFLGATQEELATTVHTRLGGYRVAQLMRSPVRCLEYGQRLGSLTHYWTGTEVVTIEGRYVGLADGQQLMTADANYLVGDFTDRSAPALAPDDDIGRSALDQLLESGYPLLAVVDKGMPIGVLLMEDLARYVGDPRSQSSHHN